MGLELGVAADLLQPRALGWMGARVSAAERLVSASANPMEPSARLWRELGVQAAELSSSPAHQPAYAYTAGDAPWCAASRKQSTDWRPSASGRESAT